MPINTIVKALQKEGIRIEVGGESFYPQRILRSGSYLLDYFLGVGGLAAGRIFELCGVEGGGKTTLSLVCAAAVRSQGYEVVWEDAERCFNPGVAQRIGAMGMIVAQSGYGEQAFETLSKFILEPSVGLIVVDSVAGLLPRDEAEQDFDSEKEGMAHQSRMMSRGLRKLSELLTPTSPTLIFINQIREKVGVVYGNPETTPGGRALKFWAHARIRIGKGEILTQGTEKVGCEAKLTYLKSKMTNPSRAVNIPILWGQGLQEDKDLYEAAFLLDILQKEKRKNSYLWGEERVSICAGWTEKIKPEVEARLYGVAPSQPKPERKKKT